MRRLVIKAAQIHLRLRSLVFVTLAIVLSVTARAWAGQVTPRSLTISDALAATHGVTYQVTAGIPAPSLIGSIRIQFCSNSALLDEACVAPFGFSDSAAILADQTGATGFVISPVTTGNELVLSRPPAMQSPVTAQFTFTDITNPSNGGSYYARIYTYSSSDGSGPFIDAGGLAFALSPSLAVSAEVPPYLTFCVGESITGLDCTTATEAFSDLGILAPIVISAAQSQMLVATNASNGYSMWVSGNTMTSGNNIIAAMTGGVAQAGVSQFGLNLRANTIPPIGQDVAGPGLGGVTSGYNQQNHFRFASGDTLASSPTPDDYRKYTVSYVVNVPADQPGGVYSTTLTYTCLGNF